MKLSDILMELPPIPERYNVDDALGKPIDNPKFSNDKWKCCVIAGRGHQTRRFECYEQGKTLDIADKEILREYFIEGKATCWNKHPDNGLVMLDSLKAWRKNGWNINKTNYKIYAFAELNEFNHKEIKAAIYLLNGINIGLDLPESAQYQEVWDYTGDIAGSWGGHCVFVNEYDNDGLTCVTWGKTQKMTWRFWDAYCDESYAIIDAPNNKESILDIPKLEKYLEGVS